LPSPSTSPTATRDPAVVPGASDAMGVSAPAAYEYAVTLAPSPLIATTSGRASPTTSPTATKAPLAAVGTVVAASGAPAGDETVSGAEPAPPDDVTSSVFASPSRSPAATRSAAVTSYGANAASSGSLSTHDVLSTMYAPIVFAAFHLAAISQPSPAPL
jgi:hypothetical protein